MVATRRSLGGQPSPSPPTAAAATTATTPSQLSRAQQAALKKLNISGTDALKGDAKAAKAARDQVQTYHYRGAVYAADANTPSAWLENQPKRYLKRERGDSLGADGSAVGGEVDEDEDEQGDDDDTPARPAKKQRSMPSSRGKPRAGRGGSRHSLPAKRKAAELDDEDDDDDDDNTTNMPDQFDYAVSGGQDDRARLPNWLPESSAARKDRLKQKQRNTAIPTKKSPLPNKTTMDRDIKRLKLEAQRNNYQVAPLDDDDMLSGARAQLVKLAKKQRLLKIKLLEWKQAKELLESKQREAGLLKERTPASPEREPAEQTNFQSTIDLAQSDDDSEKGDDEMVDEQWEREQEHNRLHPKSKSKSKAAQPEHELEIPESSAAPGASPVRQHDQQCEHQQDQQPTPDPPNPSAAEAAQTTAGASRPQTPEPTASNASMQPPTTRTHTPATNPPTNPTITGKTQTQAATPSTGANKQSRLSTSSTATNTPSTTSQNNSADITFAHLPPSAPLPTTAADGTPIRWSITSRKSVDPADGQEREEFEMSLVRLQGESKSARNRRVKRERGVVEAWNSRGAGGEVEGGEESGGV